MHDPPGGLHAFLRAYYHVKSADWPDNKPHPLAGWSGAALAQLPHYYVMPAGLGMPAAVAPTHRRPTTPRAAHGCPTRISPSTRPNSRAPASRAV